MFEKRFVFSVKIHHPPKKYGEIQKWQSNLRDSENILLLGQCGRSQKFF